jgi:hypothetical protein
MYNFSDFLLQFVSGKRAKENLADYDDHFAEYLMKRERKKIHSAITTMTAAW